MMGGNREALNIAREAHGYALSAAQTAQSALAAIDKHTAVCAERSKNTDEKLVQLFDQNKWVMRGLVTVLIGIAGLFIQTWLKSKGLM